MEPHAVTTVATPRVLMDRPRTLQEYQADIIRRYGRLPSWEALAKRENNAMHARLATSTMARTQKPQSARTPVQARTPEVEARRIASLQSALAAKSATARQKIMAAITKPMTVQDICTATGLSRQFVTGHLSQMVIEGTVAKQIAHRVAIWHRAAKGAEG